MKTILHFAEQFFDRIWGGKRLRNLYGTRVPAGRLIGEAWLISDHPGHESVVDEGPHTGRTLHELITESAQAVLGKCAALTPHGRFPLLLKLLDSSDMLSVQVHPDDEWARRLGETDVGKTEMWYVLDAEPTSELICGLQDGVTIADLREALHRGTVDKLLKCFRVQVGDTVFVPAGTVHAVGAGILLAEIQQNSDLTYRLYDWGRTGANGKPRTLHVEKALQAVQFCVPQEGLSKRCLHSASNAEHTVLAACPHFVAERIEVMEAYERVTRGDSFHIILAVAGRASVSAGECERAMKPAEAVLVSGDCDHFCITGPGSFLDYYVPNPEVDAVKPPLYS